MAHQDYGHGVVLIPARAGFRPSGSGGEPAAGSSTPRRASGGGFSGGAGCRGGGARRRPTDPGVSDRRSCPASMVRAMSGLRRRDDTEVHAELARLLHRAEAVPRIPAELALVQGRASRRGRPRALRVRPGSPPGSPLPSSTQVAATPVASASARLPPSHCTGDRIGHPRIPSVGAGREGQDRGRATRRMGRDQEPRHRFGRRRRQREHLRREHQSEPRRAVGAEPAVAHDFERAFARGAAAESVAGVREPVLVQGAGGEEGGGDGEHNAQAGRKDQVREPETRRPRTRRSARQRAGGNGAQPRVALR